MAGPSEGKSDHGDVQGQARRACLPGEKRWHGCRGSVAAISRADPTARHGSPGDLTIRPPGTKPERLPGPRSPEAGDPETPRAEAGGVRGSWLSATLSPASSVLTPGAKAGLARRGRAPGRSRCPGPPDPARPRLQPPPPAHPPARWTDQARRLQPRRAQSEPDSGPGLPPTPPATPSPRPLPTTPSPARLTCRERRAHIARPRRPLRRRRRQARPRRSGCRPSPRPPPPEALPCPAPSAPALPGKRGVRCWRRSPGLSPGLRVPYSAWAASRSLAADDWASCNLGPDSGRGPGGGSSSDRDLPTRLLFSAPCWLEEGCSPGLPERNG